MNIFIKLKYARQYSDIMRYYLKYHNLKYKNQKKIVSEE